MNIFSEIDNLIDTVGDEDYIITDSPCALRHVKPLAIALGVAVAVIAVLAVIIARLTA